MELKATVSADELVAVHRIDHRHLLRLAVFLALYAGAATGAVLLATNVAGPASLLARLPLYLVAAASLHGISLFVHEAVHGVLSPRKAWNHALAVLCALPVGQNFAAYRVLHLRHHQDTGGALDPDDYRNYSSRGWLVFVMHWLRLLVGYPVYLVMIPILALRHATARESAWILLEVALLAGLIAGTLFSPLPRAVLVHAWLVPMLCINFMVNIRGMSQHTLLPEAQHRIKGTRTILANPVVTFFMCNENYHLEHHLYPQVPWYNLPRLHRAISGELAQQGAPFIPSYLHFVRIFVSESFALLRAAPAHA